MTADIGPQCLDPHQDAQGRLVRCGTCPQEQFLATTADIAIGGGSAGGGKTWALLMEAARYVGNPDFGAVVMRREMPRITQEGGMWDESVRLYPYVGGRRRESPTHQWAFPSGATIAFTHCQHETDKDAYAGAQIPLLCFDQLEEFTSGQFWFLFGRCRWPGDPGRAIRPYLRATCNPVPATHWLHQLLQWWIDPVSGYAIPERSGRVRWLMRGADDQLDWADDRDALLARHPGVPASAAISFTFVRMALSGNLALLEKDPGYEAKLRLLPRVERERLLGGNWNIVEAAGLIFDRAKFGVPLSSWPLDPTGRPIPVTGRVRYWDKAGTEGGGRFTAGVRLARLASGLVLIEDVTRGQWSAATREGVILQCALTDPAGTEIWLEQEPGSGGKESAELSVRMLAGYAARADKVTGDKVTRAGPLAAQVDIGNVRLLAAPWNEAFLMELHNFTGAPGDWSDQVDAASGAFVKAALRGREPRLLEVIGL
jgi:predicted phage terminase large subunit-like protein